jgi:hypothetical protein
LLTINLLFVICIVYLLRSNTGLIFIIDSFRQPLNVS